MKRVFGYVLIILGLLLLGSGITPVYEKIVSVVPYFATFNSLALMVSGFLFLLVGAFILRGSSSGRQSNEVPIYHGKNVVGFRRMGKK